MEAKTNKPDKKYHAGSIPLTYTADEFAKEGHPSPYCAVAIKAYRDRKYGSEKAHKLKKKLEEIIQEQTEVDPDNLASFYFDDQHGLVVYAFGERKGTESRGFGGQLRRPSKIWEKADLSQQYEESRT